MAGGIGSRFWPQSRTHFPKQFLDILGVGKSLLQMTYERFLPIVPEENIFIVTNEAYIPLVKKQLPKLSNNQILGEPLRRNTAPCVGYASFKIHQLNPEARIVFSPADHLITQESVFHKVINNSFDFLRESKSLLTIGITPSRPDTNYGYIQFVDKGKERGFHEVKTFTEKPDYQLANTFLESGDFLWNSGIFIWRSTSIIDAFQKHLPELYDLFKEGEPVYNSKKERPWIQDAYAQCTNISIDYGIMEKASNVNVIKSNFGWSDLGTWNSLYAQMDKDYLGNAVLGKKVLVYEANNCLVSAPKDKQVVLNGLRDLIVVDTEDVLLICKMDKEGDIKNITSEIKRQSGEKFL